MNSEKLTAEQLLQVVSSQWASASDIMKIGSVGRNKAYAIRSEIAISLIILVVTTVLLATIAIKVYSSTILNTGARLKLKDAIKMAKENK